MSEVFIDFGSSTTKVYKTNDAVLVLLKTYSIPIKKEIAENNIISEKMINSLISIINWIKNDYKGYSIKNIATAFFRKIENRRHLVNKIFLETWISLNIISHDLENFYLQNSLTAEIKTSWNILLMNIWWGSTELVLIKNCKPFSVQNINIWVWTIIKEFPSINIWKYSWNVDNIINYVQSNISDFPEIIDFAIYWGWELTYMKKVGYLLEQNDLFIDVNHPLKISDVNFFENNKKVLFYYDIEELKQRMPNDPNWMLWARACSVIAESIIKKFSIKYIIPSDTNTIHGFLKKEFRTATISWSFRKHLEYIVEVKNYLLRNWVQILSPRFNIAKNSWEEFVIFEWEEWKSPLELEEYHLESIYNSDVLIVCSPDWYVWASSLFEIWYANSLWKRILFTEEPEEFLLKNMPHELLKR